MSFKSMASLVLGLLVMVGCGSGGRSGPTGKVCPKNFEPLPVDVDNPNQKPNLPLKLSFEAGENSILNYPGTYSYDSAQLYYKNTRTGVQMLLNETLDKRTKQFKIGITCVSGLSPVSEKFSFTAMGLSKMDVQSNKLATFGVRSFAVHFENSKFPLQKAEEGDGSKFDKPSKIYEGVAAQYFLYKAFPANTDHYEARSRFINGDESLDVAIRMKRVSPPAESKAVTQK